MCQPAPRGQSEALEDMRSDISYAPFQLVAIILIFKIITFLFSLTSQMFKSYYVYILQCSDGSYYTGVINDPDNRLLEHQAGLNRDSYTFYRRPVKCVYVSEFFTDPMQAIEWEKQIKGWSRKKKEALIQDKWELSLELSKSKKQKEEGNANQQSDSK